MKPLDWLSVVAYFVAIAYFGWRKQSRTKSMADYARASAAYGALAACASLTSAYIGPGFTLGLAEKGFTHGLVFLLVFLGFSLQTALVGIFLAPRLNAYTDAFTVGDVIGQHYGRGAQFLTGIISTLYCAGIVGVVARAGGATFSAMTGTPVWLGAILTTAILLIYATRGGVKAIVATNDFHFLVMLVTIPILLVGSWLALSHTPTAAPLPPTHLTATGTFTPLAIAGLFVGFLLGETLVPPYAARCLVTRKPSQARQAFVLSSGISVLWFAMMVGIGMIGYRLMPTAEPSNIVIALTFKILGTGLAGFILAGILSIVISTQDSFLNSAAVCFTRDCWGSVDGRLRDSEQRQLKVAMATTLIVGVLGVGFALTIPGLIEGILIVYTLWAPTVIIPLSMALLFKVRHRYAGLAAIIGGGAVTAVWEWVLGNPFGVPSLLPGVAANVVLFMSVWLLSKAPSTSLPVREKVEAQQV